VGLKRRPQPPKTRHKITPHDNGTYLIESKSAPGEHYVVIDEEPTCPCKGFEVRKICTHVEDAVIELLRKALEKKRAEENENLDAPTRCRKDQFNTLTN
jgi:hypothetical protein